MGKDLGLQRADFQQADLWLQRSLCWLQQKDYAAAMSDLIRAYQKSPSDAVIQKTIRQMKEIYEREEEHGS